MTREEAIERLAYELNWKQQQLDPDTDEPDAGWSKMETHEKRFLYYCVEWIMAQPDLVLAALDLPSNHLNDRQ